jgi:hypothetical protein
MREDRRVVGHFSFHDCSMVMCGYTCLSHWGHGPVPPPPLDPPLTLGQLDDVTAIDQQTNELLYSEQRRNDDDDDLY